MQGTFSFCQEKVKPVVSRKNSKMLRILRTGGNPVSEGELLRDFPLNFQAILHVNESAQSISKDYTPLSRSRHFGFETRLDGRKQRICVYSKDGVRFRFCLSLGKLK